MSSKSTYLNHFIIIYDTQTQPQPLVYTVTSLTPYQFSLDKLCIERKINNYVLEATIFDTPPSLFGRYDSTLIKNQEQLNQRISELQKQISYYLISFKGHANQNALCYGKHLHCYTNQLNKKRIGFSVIPSIVIANMSGELIKSIESNELYLDQLCGINKFDY